MAHARPATRPKNPLPDTPCATCARRSGEDGMLLGNRPTDAPLLAFCGRCVPFLKGAIASWEGGS